MDSESPPKNIAELSDESLEKRHWDLAHKLIVSMSVIKDSWESFQSTSAKFTLEGDPMHWFACSLYAASRKTNLVATTSKKTKESLSVTKLLRIANLSFKQFMVKINSWANMTKLTSDSLFMECIRKEDQHFHVSFNVSKRYHLWFSQIFHEPDMEKNTARDLNSIITPMQLYDFLWTLFILLKSKLNQGSDLVKCIQIMASCLDIGFSNVVHSKLTYLLNGSTDFVEPYCRGEPYAPPEKNVSIISKLLGGPHTDNLAETMHTKQYNVLKSLARLIEEDSFKGDKTNCTQLFDEPNFDHNYFIVKSLYEKYIRSNGCFDERIFLAEAQRQFLLKSLYANGERMLETPKTYSSREAMPFARDTPLTGRSYIGPKEPVDPNGPSADSMARIMKMLESETGAPSSALSEAFLECENNPAEKIVEILERMGNEFVDGFTENDKFAVKNLGVNLFYKMLENILNFEKKNTRDALLAKGVFHECLFACSLEIILDAKKSNKIFPWILEVFKIQSSYFVRIIELVIRSTDDFSRDTIKHLSSIEESILDKYIWASSSEFWKELAKVEIPKFEEVALPGTIDTSSNGRLANSNHTGSSAVETFQSPVRNIKPGQSLLNLNRTTHLLVTSADGTKTLIPVDSSSQLVETNKQKKVSTIGIIFRKLYHLAHVRMDHLCKTLGITEVDLKRKIWTVFEYSIMKHTHLFRDRHLDQLIMCAVYIICRITEQSDKKFSDILKCYRYQPQAKSEIYRVVYIKTNEAGVDEFSNLIVFYNDIYVGIMKKFIAKFSDARASSENLGLSMFPSTKLQIASPRRQITNTVYLRTHESPVQDATGDKYHCCFFSRSAATDLRDLNNAINKKRPVSDLQDGSRPLKKVATRKMQALIEERKVQNNVE